MRLTDPEQIKAVLHPLRRRILEQLEGGPATPSEVARAIGVAASKAHYHVRILEKAGLVKLVETRQIGSVTETYFAAVARHFETNVNPREQPEYANEAMATVMREIQATLKTLHRLSTNPAEAAGRHGFLSIGKFRAGTGDETTVQVALKRLEDGLAKVRELSPNLRYRMIVSLAPVDESDEPDDTDEPVQED